MAGRQNGSPTLAGKIAFRAMGTDQLAEAAPVIADALAGTTEDTTGNIGAGVIAASFDPEAFITPP